VLDGQTQLGAASLVAGAASYSTTNLSVGSHSITVTYSGDANFAPSASTPVSVAVAAPAKINTSTSLSVSAPQITAGSSVTFNTRVAPASGSVAPTGTISFLDSQVSIGSVALTSASAQFSAANLSAGTHSIIAVYSGDANFQPSSSLAATVTVASPPAADYSLSLPSAALTVNAGAAAALTLTVTPKNGFKQPVTFACSGLPSGATSTFSPPSVTPANGPAATTMTIQVPVTRAMVITANPGKSFATYSLVAGSLVRGISARTLATRLRALCILQILVLAFSSAGNRIERASIPEQRPRAMAKSLALLLPLLAGGCASLPLGSSPAPRATTYSLTVTASGANVPTHSETLTLTVAP